jgi:hypothetical protein
MGTGWPSRENRGLSRFHRDDLHARVERPQALRVSPQRPRGAHALHEPIDAPAGLTPDLFCHQVVGGDLIAIPHLVGPESSGIPGDDPRGLDDLARQCFCHAAPVAGHDPEPCAEPPHVVQLLLRKRIGGDKVQRVTLHRAHQGQRDTSAASRVLDDRTAGSRPSASAAATIASAIRSFMLPVGFCDSSLTRIRAALGGWIRRRASIGVLPTRARMSSRKSSMASL